MKKIRTTHFESGSKRVYASPVCTVMSIPPMVVLTASPDVPYNPNISTGEALSSEFDPFDLDAWAEGIFQP